MTVCPICEAGMVERKRDSKGRISELKCVECGSVLIIAAKERRKR